MMLHSWGEMAKGLTSAWALNAAISLPSSRFRTFKVIETPDKLIGNRAAGVSLEAILESCGA
jgi:hypothetical protein